jgi:peptidoglycan-associated lipoprotein
MEQSRESTRSGVRVDDAISKACNMPTPHFDFDSSAVRERSDAHLDALATCFTTGPMSGKNLALVGHADPRGETEYNMELGQRRAGEVQSYLATHGMVPSRIQTSSRGAMDAVGTDETTWADDRHVDVVLGR